MIRKPGMQNQPMFQGRQPPQLPTTGRGLATQQPGGQPKMPTPQQPAGGYQGWQGGAFDPGGFDPNTYAAGVQAQAAKDQAAFGAYGNLGIAAQNAMGQYGMNRDAQLTNQSIAAANAYGSMANSYYNTMGQLGNVAGGMTAAGLNAGAQSAVGSSNSNIDLNFGAGWGGGGGWPGFTASGPEGTIASGRFGGGGGGGGGFGVGGGGGSSTSVNKGSSVGERKDLINQGYGFLGGVQRQLNDPKNQAMTLAGLMGDQFNANRAAVMDPSIINSLNSQLSAGYGALGGLYDRSDYGFNTGRRAPAPSYTAQQATPDYWMQPWKQRAPRMNPGGSFR